MRNAMLTQHAQTPSRAWLWTTSAFCAAIVLAGLVIAVRGTDEAGVKVAVRVAALLSFLLFFLAYAGRPLATCFGQPFEGLARRGRELGLAFAAVLSVHLGLVVLMAERSAKPFVFNRLEVAEIIGATWIFALAVFSIPRLCLVLSAAAWRRLRVLGMDYIAFLFAYNLIPFLLNPLYLPFSLLAVGAIVLRIAAAIQNRPHRIGRHLAHDGSSLRAGPR